MGRKKQKRHRVILQLTPAGWAFLGISLLVGVAAMRSHMPMMFIFFGAMLGVMAVAGWLARSMLRGVHVRRELPSRAWQFETLYFGYYLRNARRLGALALRLNEIAPEGVEDARGYCVWLPGKQVFRSGSRIAADRRGRVALQGVRLSTAFPFGLAIMRRDIDQSMRLVVWPAKGRIKSEFLHHGAKETSAAPAGRHQGGQDEFFGLRDYRQGDNPRWIHWRRSAGRALPVVREMAHPVPDVLMLILDVECTDDSESAKRLREKMLRFAATVVDHAMGRGYQVALAMSGDDEVKVVPPGVSVQTRIDVLDALAEVPETPNHSINEVIRRIPVSALAQAQAWIITGDPHRLTPSRRGQLVNLASHVELIGPEELSHVFEDHPLGDWSGPEIETLGQRYF